MQRVRVLEMAVFLAVVGIATSSTSGRASETPVSEANCASVWGIPFGCSVDQIRDRFPNAPERVEEADGHSFHVFGADSLPIDDEVRFVAVGVADTCGVFKITVGFQPGGRVAAKAAASATAAYGRPDGRDEIAEYWDDGEHRIMFSFLDDQAVIDGFVKGIWAPWLRSLR